MIIKSLSIQNIKSIGNKVTLHFEDGINILIGPNGGGKSNIMDILNIVLNTYFIWHWNENVQPLGKIRYTKENLANFFELSKHDEINDSQKQEIELELKFSEDDLRNIDILKSNLSRIAETEEAFFSEHQSEIKDQFNNLLNIDNFNNLKDNLTQRFSFSVPTLTTATANDVFNSFNEFQKILFRYLNYFEKIKYLIEKHNEGKQKDEIIPEMKYMMKFYSSNRFHEGQGFEIALPGQNRIHKYKELKEKTSSKTASDIEYSTYFFAHKFNELDRDNDLFQSEPQVTKVKELFKIVGNYDFSIETINKSNNTYQFIIKSDSKEIEFNKLSSGEKEVFNFIFSIIALDLKDAILIIDEPEIHLHPQWQYKLIDLYKKIIKDRNLQFVITTHSPVFVSSDTITNITRIYKLDRQTKILPEEKSFDWKSELGKKQDLIDIITYSNNAKMFFTDTVVLVEGITDEIIFSYLLDELNTERKNIEIISVNGKDNFRKYITFLNKFKIKPVVVCDLDNLWDGELLRGQYLTEPIKSKITEFWKNRDLESLKEYLNASAIKSEITNRVVGSRLLDIVCRIDKEEELDESDKNFISHWINKCIDKRKILNELNISEVYKDNNSSISSLEDIASKLKSGIPFDNNSCPIFILNEGSLEDYCENISHGKKGALKFLSELKAYFRNGEADNSRFESLKNIVSEFLKIL